MIRPLLLIAALAAFPALAQEVEPRWYQVEIVLFLNDTAAKVTYEDWSRDPGRPDLSDAVTLQPIPEAAAGLQPFQILAPEELELTDALDKLQRSGHYRPLLHTAWRQPVTENQSTFPAVRIDAPLGAPPAPPLPAEATSASTAETALPPSGGALPPEPGTSAAEAAPDGPEAGIEGIIRLRVSRYLHLDVDLLYLQELPLLPETLQTPAVADGGAGLSGAAPAAAQQPFVSGLMADFLGLANTFFQPYRLTEQRRLRRDELHYFDHPQFGLLAKVSAYEPPAAQSPSAVPAAAPSLPVPVTNPGKATAQPLR